ncbi:hypothetical protein [Actinoplanes sp. NPDC048796]|uniref:hypothetical protein n=1 Tax=Actinoplanes sp. NPDC048796 TaxID=3155640 RepID=UPI0033C9A6B7
MPTTELSGATAYHGRVLGEDGVPIGTCFQAVPGILVTAHHVLDEIGRAVIGSTVYFEPMVKRLDGQEPTRIGATVEKLDVEGDIAILRAEAPLATSVLLFSFASIQPPSMPVSLVGFAERREAGWPTQYDVLTARGVWEGQAQQSGSIVTYQVVADGVERGMSGCPVRRVADDAVVGMLSSRFNSDDRWSPGRVRITSAERIVELLKNYDSIAIQRRHIPQQERGKLSGVVLDRLQLRDNPIYFTPPEWQRPLLDAAAAFAAGKTVVVVSQPAVGSTTFAERFLATNSPPSMRLVRLDPGEWDKPRAGAIPLKAQESFMLDLRDPEQDLPSEDFWKSVSEMAPDRASLQSPLIITIRESLWNPVHGEHLKNIQAVYLNDAPSSIELVQRHLANRIPLLSEMVDASAVQKHLVGMTAVQAVDAVSRIVRLYQQRVVDGQIPLDKFQDDVVNLLDRHEEELDELFSDPADWSPRDKESKAPLKLRDRCLLLSLAGRERSRFDRLETDSVNLLGRLTSSSSRNPAASRAEAHEVLQGDGLRGRLGRIGADVERGGWIAFRRANYADAVLRYVWENYSVVRGPLASWLVDVSTEGSTQATRVAAVLTAQIRRTQDFGFVKEQLVPLTRTASADALLTRILSDLLRDQHMQPQAERLLYNWATRQELQAIVVEAARGLLGTSREIIGLRRLRRVADAERHAAGILERILKIFRDAAADPEAQSRFLSAVNSWCAESPRSRSSQLGFIAALSATVNGSLWLLSRPVLNAYAVPMLSEVLMDRTVHDALASAVMEIIATNPSDETIFELLARAAARGAGGAFFDFCLNLKEFESDLASDPVDRLMSKIKISAADVDGHALED